MTAGEAKAEETWMDAHPDWTFPINPSWEDRFRLIVAGRQIELVRPYVAESAWRARLGRDGRSDRDRSHDLWNSLILGLAARGVPQRVIHEAIEKLDGGEPFLYEYLPIESLMAGWRGEGLVVHRIDRGTAGSLWYADMAYSLGIEHRTRYAFRARAVTANIGDERTFVEWDAPQLVAEVAGQGVRWGVHYQEVRFAGTKPYSHQVESVLKRIADRLGWRAE